jgi:hypothetical protein
MEKRYEKGRYYQYLGFYLGTRKTTLIDKTNKKEHIFSTGVYDGGGAVILNRVLINHF